MKKLLCVLLILCMIPVAALSDPDLSSMSYDELMDLHKQIIFEIMSRPEWKEVTVPAGTWKIGEDIPEGTYSISTDAAIMSIEIWGKEPKDFSAYIDSFSPKKDAPVGKVELKAGWTIVLSRDVVFAPPVLLGF